MTGTHKSIIPDAVRNLCYQRDQGQCQWAHCGSSRANGDVVHLHHLLPEQFGGKEDPDNLITLCDIHHKGMHADFHAFYPDSQSVLHKMNRYVRTVLSAIRRLAHVDDGYDLAPYLYYLTRKRQFRPGQLQTIRAALSGKDVLLVTPTGSGKSVCYQLPGLLGAHPSLVISPLKALMKDQVEGLWAKKIPTTYINSDLSTAEKSKRYQFIGKQLYKFIFAAPERFFMSRDPQVAQLYTNYSYLVVDEAHEIEMWGMAFRPSYRKLGDLHQALGKPPLIALTATAAKSTQDAILASLNIPDAKVIVTGFYRDNISITIHRADAPDAGYQRPVSKYQFTTALLDQKLGQKTLLFVPTVKCGNELLASLQADGYDVEFYHSGLDAKEKMRIQNRFTGIAAPYLGVLISTTAFGMGIDIPDIRTVINWAPPLSLTDFVQQIGRAGRDTKPAEAYLLYEDKDEGLMHFMAELPLRDATFKEKHAYTDEDVAIVRKKLRHQVTDMLKILDVAPGQEWAYILDYFGETQAGYWERNGRRVVDGALATLLVGAVAAIWLLLAG